MAKQDFIRHEFIKVSEKPASLVEPGEEFHRGGCFFRAVGRSHCGELMVREINPIAKMFHDATAVKYKSQEDIDLLERVSS